MEGATEPLDILNDPQELIDGDVQSIGQTCGGYVLGGVIGKGGFGKVYKGLNLQTGQFSAVKVLNSQSIKLQQIQKEIDILRKVNHPNIIKYLDCSDVASKEKPYIIFEYIENGSLKDVIKKFGTFSEELAKRYVFQVKFKNSKKNSNFFLKFI